ncbi:hypothetical protein PMIN06_000584 [Paraphaeosphaeria minitans]
MFKSPLAEFLSDVPSFFKLRLADHMSTTSSASVNGNIMPPTRVLSGRWCVCGWWGSDLWPPAATIPSSPRTLRSQYSPEGGVWVAGGGGAVVVEVYDGHHGGNDAG